MKDIEFKNKCGCSVDYTMLSDAMNWATGTTNQHTRKSIFIHNSYPSISIGGQKMPIHRLLMSYQIKRRIANNICVHHIDENKLNAQVENLQKLTKSAHQALHMTGKKRSEETKRKISESLRKRRYEQI